jgi:hypothetical protein
LQGTTPGNRGSGARPDFFELLAQHGADLCSYLLRKAGALYVVSEGIVDQGLIITSVCFANLISEVIDDISVQSYGDADLVRW